MSDYLLSFDPAPINMAYCLVDIETLKIIKWGMFSIKDSTNEGSSRKLAQHLMLLLFMNNNRDVI
jgi:hypothetical protein